MKDFWWIAIPLSVLLAACGNNVYKENVSITKYVEEKKYFEALSKENVKFLKCYPSADGKEMVATYTTIERDNDFPATVRFNYVVNRYSIYFDIAYLNSPKEKLIKDIDDCFSSWEKLKTAHNTWK